VADEQPNISETAAMTAVAANAAVPLDQNARLPGMPVTPPRGPLPAPQGTIDGHQIEERITCRHDHPAM